MGTPLATGDPGAAGPGGGLRTLAAALYGFNDVVIGRGVGYAAGVALAASLVVMALQVISRYVFNASFIWGEELTRYLMIWSAMLGAATAYHRGQHTAMTYLVDRLPPGSGRLALIFGHLAVLALLVVVTWQGWGLTLRNAARMQLSPALQWPIWYVYLAIPVGSFLMAISACTALLTGRRAGGETGAD